MRKHNMTALKSVLLLFGVVLSVQQAYAQCQVGTTNFQPTGTQACRGPSYSPSNMTVQTCQSSELWVTTGPKCTCNYPNGYVKSADGQWTCMGAYTTS